MIDRIDKAILLLLQEDSTMAVVDIAQRVHLSSTPCWRRIQRLESEGIIRRRVVLLDQTKVNVSVTVLVQVKASRHSPEWLQTFCDAVVEIPEVVEVYRMSGSVDYVLKVVVPNIAGYDGVYQKLINSVELQDVSSSFAMEVIKSTTALPLTYAV